MKSAKLYVEQGQIEERLNQAMISSWVDRKDEYSPPFAFTGTADVDRIRLTANPYRFFYSKKRVAFFLN